MTPTSVAAVDWWFQQLQNIPARQTVVAPNFFRPFHFVTLALAVQQAGAGGLVLPPQFMGYAARMKVWEAAGLPCPITVAERETGGRFCPVQRLVSRDAVDESAVQVARVAKTFGASKRTMVSLEIALNEIMENCFAHGATGGPIPGVACAQSWPDGARAQIAIADPGLGIRTSLSDTALLAPRLLTTNACELATEFGITGKPGQGHAGYGLTLTRQLLERNEGTLVVASHGEYFCSNGAIPSAGVLTHMWPGTLIVFEWNTRVPLEVREVYDRWPLPEGMTEDDYRL